MWEAVYIIDGLLKNKSDVQPGTVHADTQGQSLPVFALAHLLGIKLFDDPVDWDLLKTRWRDLLQVVLSIKVGKVLPSTLLRKLGNNSRTGFIGPSANSDGWCAPRSC